MNPLRALLDPVAVKELSGSARRWQTYVTRGIYIVLCGWILWSYSDDILHASARFSPSTYARLGRDIFQAFIALQVGLALLFGASAASDLLSKEVRLGTLGVLACGPLTPWRIAFGKWKAAMAQTVSLLFCGLPVFGICAYLGGVTPVHVLCGFCISISAAGLASAVGLYFSSLFRSLAGALMLSLGVLAAYFFLPIIWFERDAAWSTFFAHTQLAYALQFGIFDRGRSSLGLTDAWWSACTISLIAALGLVRAAAGRIALLAVRTPTVPLITRFFAALDRYYETHNPGNILIFSRGDAVWESRALLWKELQTRASGRLRNSVRISLVLLLILAIAFTVELRYLYVPIWISTLLLWFLALSNGASLFVKEKEERKWDILLATPLGSWDIVGAKLLAGMVPILPALSIFALFWGASSLVNRLTAGDIFISMLSIVLPAAFAYLIGTVCSLRARSLRGSFTAALSFVTGVMLVIPLLCTSTHDLSDLRAAWISPAPYIDAMCRHGLRSTYYSDVTELVSTFTLIYGGASLLLLMYLYGSFNRISGRSGEA